MSAPSRGGNAVSALLRTTLSLSARRFYSATAAAAVPSDASSSTQPPPVSQQQQQQTATTATRYKIKSSIVLTRPPLLTRPRSAFESAFYLYQKRLNERLSAPFRRDFYFKNDTANDLDWRIKIRERHGVPAKDIGRYNPRGRLAWNDEVLVDSPTSDPVAGIVEPLLRDAEMRVSEDGEAVSEEDRVPIERPLPRRTEADEKGDQRRLDRALDRTLYLVVQQKKTVGKEGEEIVWQFPTGDVPTDEVLHETATRILAESAGVNMNTWLVGRVPVAHHVNEPVLAEDQVTPKKRGEKVFFLKGRIMAGQADLAGNRHGLVDFKWLTKDELKALLPAEYYHSVRNMMADR
ncbi:39S mitochondrial ribosomal protein L46-domain-containing protein [Bombardia bombarda]|uniref:Large ribosomal subunit protein mL46 n=1 Tax=Bombardia bombarda TaxID=252184 RepID=A0AA39WTW6_9PEZI|nr:39S mitochondrial ribosomal protein L46-domain-containing protein [Bombardia bombarda]